MRRITLLGVAVVAATSTLGLVGAAEAAPAGPAVAPGAVNCGKVKAPRGPVDVIAERGPAGIPGCTAAITVMTEYFEQAATRSQGTARVLTVRGWRCMTDTGAQGSGKTACDRDGQVFHT